MLMLLVQRLNRWSRRSTPLMRTNSVLMRSFTGSLLDLGNNCCGGAKRIPFIPQIHQGSERDYVPADSCAHRSSRLCYFKTCVRCFLNSLVRLNS